MSKAELIKRFSDYVYYFNAYCTSDAEDHEMLKAVLALLKEQDVEIAFLKEMQLQTVHNMSNEDIGNAVRNVLRL
jgi:hypothetical protein